MAASITRRALTQPIPFKFLQSAISLKSSPFQLPFNGKQLVSTANRKIKDTFLPSSTICSEFPPLVRKGDFESTIVTDKYDIQRAQALLFENYKENRWIWSENNPTGFQCKTHLGQNYVTDKFDDNSAVWIGAFDQEHLVSGIRLIFRTTQNPLLDLEEYESGQKSCIQNFIRSKDVAEISRFVTAPEYRSNGICGTYSLLVLFMLLSNNNFEAVFTSQLDFFGKYGIGTLMDKEFDYGDGVHTKALFYSKSDIHKIVNMLTKKIQS